MFPIFFANDCTLLFISLPHGLMLRTQENEDVSKQIFVLKLFDKSVKYTDNKIGSEMEPCGTPARVSIQDKH